MPMHIRMIGINICHLSCLHIEQNNITPPGSFHYTKQTCCRKFSGWSFYHIHLLIGKVIVDHLKIQDIICKVIHETEIISVLAISEVEMVEIISVLNLKKSDSHN
jgi:hypothetical protein